MIERIATYALFLDVEFLIYCAIVNVCKRFLIGSGHLENKKRINRRQIIQLSILMIVFLVVFQLYVVVERKSYKQVDDVITPSFSAIEGSKEDEEHEFYISNQKEVFDQLITGLDRATFKPSNRIPANPLYQLHLYNESLEVATTIIVRENNQMEVNEVLYAVDGMDLSSFEREMFSEEHAFTLQYYEDFTSALNKIYEGPVFEKSNHEWAEVIAFVRIADEINVDLNDIGLLSIVPTKEVAEQLITYGMTEWVIDSPFLVAVLNELPEVAEVFLENGIGIENNQLLEKSVSPVALAKLNEDEKMVDLLLSYGFEDVSVEPEHIKAVRQVVDFESEDPEEMIKNLEDGKLPGLHFRLPLAANEIIDMWGDDYIRYEDAPYLFYNYHHFFADYSTDTRKLELDAMEVIEYIYQFPPEIILHKDTVMQVLGQHGEIYEYMDGKEYGSLWYSFGEYDLSLPFDKDGYIHYLNYSYEGDLLSDS